MSSGVWMSSVLSVYALGDKPGVRTKFYGYDWEPAEFIAPRMPGDVYANMNRVARGFALKREELPEAAAVWNEKRFKLLGDVFWASGFLVVRGKLAQVLARFDLGEGGLVPFPVYQADLVTHYPGEFFLLNFGAIKNTILPDQCEDARKFFVAKDTGLQLWHVNDYKPDGEIVVSTRALAGPDLWMEEAVPKKIFMSHELAQAIIEIGMSDIFRLKQCRVAEDAALARGNGRSWGFIRRWISRGSSAHERKA
jgi:hypothetical protein